MSKKGESQRKPSQLLRDLRHVYKEPPEADKSEAHRALRGIKNSDYGDFIDRLQKAEQAHRAGLKSMPMPVKVAADGSKAGQVVADEGSERVQELIGKLLAEAEAVGVCEVVEGGLVT